jgi:hypothetical protein
LPSYEDVKDDIAISTVPNINIGKFHLEQVKTWMDAVAFHGNQQKISKHKPTIAQIYIDFQYYSTLIVNYIGQEYEKEKEKWKTNDSKETANHNNSNKNNNNDPDANKKRKHSEFAAADSLFGKTTISSRMQAYESHPSHQHSNANQQGDTELDNFPGKLLLKLTPKDIIRMKLMVPPSSSPSPAGSLSNSQQSLPLVNTATPPISSSSTTSIHLIPYDENDVKIVSDYFRQAIQRRSSYDKLMMAKQHEKMLELKRMKIEEANNVQSRKKLMETRNPTSVTYHNVSEKEKEREPVNAENPQITFVDDFDLEDLIGGPITSVKSSFASSSSSSNSMKRPSVVPSSSSGGAPKANALAATVGKSPPSAKNIVVKSEPLHGKTSATTTTTTQSPDKKTTTAIPAVKVSPSQQQQSQPVAVKMEEVPPPQGGEAPASQEDHPGGHPHHTAVHHNKPGMKPRRKVVIN